MTVTPAPLPAPPTPLDAEQCKLLKRFPDKLAPVLAVYNQAVEFARKLADKYPTTYALDITQEAVAKLAETREKLTTPRFKVGFLGPFQCGKSTVMNKLLGQDISAIGYGPACTSVITRLIVTPNQPAPELKLQYFTTAGYRERRNTLCEWARVSNPEGRTEAQLLESLKTHTPDARGDTARRPVRQKDIPYLRALLQSYESHKSRDIVRADALVEKVAYADKDRLLRHDPNATENHIPADQSLLVAESSITFATDQVDAELELIDCPGLGSGRSVDDLLTGEYIKHLDGALVFVRANAMDSADVNEILGKLRAKFGDDLRARVWVVVNQMDVPERHAKIGGTNGKTTFDAIVDLMRENKIPLSQVCLACNGIFQQAVAAGGTAPRIGALAKIDLTPDDDAAVKGKLHPELVAAYEELLKDGSISRLRGLMREKVGPSVAAQILVKAGADANRALAELKYALANAEKPANEQELGDAADWDTELFRLLRKLSGGLSGGRGELFVKLEKLSQEARAQLQKAFLDRLPGDADLADMTRRDVLDRLDVDARRMQVEVNNQFDRVMQTAYTEVTGQLEARNLPTVTLPGGDDPMTVWRKCVQQDRDGDWREESRPSLDAKDLVKVLEEVGLATTFDGLKYKRLFTEKLRTASHQLALATRGRLRSRLGGIRREVRRKLGARAAATAAQAPAAHATAPATPE